MDASSTGTLSCDRLPVGQFCIQSACMMGAERIIAIDRLPERLEMARTYSHAETVNFVGQDGVEVLKAMTAGRAASYHWLALTKRHNLNAYFQHGLCAGNMRLALFVTCKKSTNKRKSPSL